MVIVLIAFRIVIQLQVLRPVVAAVCTWGQEMDKYHTFLVTSN
jgi:hypothetical protein